MWRVQTQQSVGPPRGLAVEFVWINGVVSITIRVLVKSTRNTPRLPIDLLAIPHRGAGGKKRKQEKKN